MTEQLEKILNDLPYSIRHSGEIEELKEFAREQAERVEELEKELNGTKYRLGYKQMFAQCNRDYASLNYEKDRYKQALERILDFYPGVPNAEYIPIEMPFEIKNIARKALERDK